MKDVVAIDFHGEDPPTRRVYYKIALKQHRQHYKNGQWVTVAIKAIRKIRIADIEFLKVTIADHEWFDQEEDPTSSTKNHEFDQEEDPTGSTKKKTRLN